MIIEPTAADIVFLFTHNKKNTIMNIYEVSVSAKLVLSKKQIDLLMQSRLFKINTEFITFDELQAATTAREAKSKVYNKYKQLLPFHTIKTAKANSIVSNK